MTSKPRQNRCGLEVFTRNQFRQKIKAMMVQARPHFAPNSISLTIGCTSWEIPSYCGHPPPYSKKSHHFFRGKSIIDNGEGGWLSLK